MLFGRPKDIHDRSLFHELSLVPLLAWVGLGADGLSSSAYGPPEAFLALGRHTYLAVVLAIAVAVTIVIISAAYSRIIEEFSTGGGGYLVATKLLGEHAGLVSGSALLVDYILTITTSIAAAGDALFSLLPIHLQPLKFAFEVVLIAGLTTLNIRGVKESVLALAPIFILFVITHLVLIGGGIIAHADVAAQTAGNVVSGFKGGFQSLGLVAMLGLVVHAYSLGGGTYTGLEAVSNGLLIMRAPQVQTAKRTMLYMAISLSIAASGLLVCYLLWDIKAVPGKTLNAVLAERFSTTIPFGYTFILLTLLSEGAILVVGAQAGFIAGPRVIANMALDGWAPRRFASLSERLTTQDAIGLVGVSALAALLYTKGNIQALMVMYSINVFLTFSLSMFGMVRMFWAARATRPEWKTRVALFSAGLALCLTILAITTYQKFGEGGWVTLVVTGGVVVLCIVIRRHYRYVGAQLGKLYADLEKFPSMAAPSAGPERALMPALPTAAVLVGGYSGMGIHTVLGIIRKFPGHFQNMVFILVGVVDSGEFKGEHAVDALKARIEADAKKYLELARAARIPATYRVAIGTDVVDEAETLCTQVATEFPKITFFAGKIIFDTDSWAHWFLHNETALAIEKRLHRAGQTMVIFPARVD